MKPYVHLFKTLLGEYLYDVNADVILRLKENEYMEIENYIENGEDAPCIMKSKKRILYPYIQWRR